mgnify:CR=1 FL=1
MDAEQRGAFRLRAPALGLALVVRIKEEYGTIDEDEIHVQDEEPGA